MSAVRLDADGCSACAGGTWCAFLRRSTMDLVRATRPAPKPERIEREPANPQPAPAANEET